MRVVIYTRTPTGDPLGLQAQRDACAHLADQRGWTVKETYSDPAIPGVDGDRSGFGRLLADMIAERLDVVVIDDLSRVSQRAVSLGAFLDLAARRGVRVVTVDEHPTVSPQTEQIQDSGFQAGPGRVLA